MGETPQGLIPRGRRGRLKGSAYTDRSKDSHPDYKEKEIRQGVMVNIRMSVTEHLALRALAYKYKTSMNTILRSKIFGESIPGEDA